jgi:FKBP-type peptidyl-prolyl cis-trans isomerase 2
MQNVVLIMHKIVIITKQTGGKNCPGKKMVIPSRFITLANWRMAQFLTLPMVPAEPLQFKIGEGKVIPGFEQAIAGMNTDDSKTTKIPAKNAYGPHLKEMVQSIDRTHFPEHIKPQIGQQLQIPQDDGKDILVKVAKVSESSVTLDAKHPLAGKDLTFDIQLVGIA